MKNRRSHQSNFLFAAFALSLLFIGGCSANKKPDWVVVNYWAIWCAPCREEIPELNKLAKLDPSSISVLGVNFDQPDQATLLEHSESMKIEFGNISIDTAMSMGLEKPATLPTTYILYKGELKHSLQGPQTLESLHELMPVSASK